MASSSHTGTCHSSVCFLVQARGKNGFQKLHSLPEGGCKQCAMIVQTLGRMEDTTASQNSAASPAAPQIKPPSTWKPITISSTEQSGCSMVLLFHMIPLQGPNRQDTLTESKQHRLSTTSAFGVDQEHRENPEDSEAGTPSDEQEAYATQSFPNSGASAQENPNRPRRRWLSPILVLQRGLQIAFQTVHMTSSAIGIIGAQLLPQRLIRSLQGKSPMSPAIDRASRFSVSSKG